MHNFVFQFVILVPAASIVIIGYRGFSGCMNWRKRITLGSGKVLFRQHVMFIGVLLSVFRGIRLQPAEIHQIMAQFTLNMKSPVSIDH
jgi:hypothetical protein